MLTSEQRASIAIRRPTQSPKISVPATRRMALRANKIARRRRPPAAKSALFRALSANGLSDSSSDAMEKGGDLLRQCSQHGGGFLWASPPLTIRRSGGDSIAFACPAAAAPLFPTDFCRGMKNFCDKFFNIFESQKSDQIAGDKFILSEFSICI